MFKLYYNIAVSVRPIQMSHFHGVSRTATRWQERPTRMRRYIYIVNH